MKSIKRLRERIHDETTNWWNATAPERRVEELNPILRGWANYFSQGPVGDIYRRIDDYTARRRPLAIPLSAGLSWIYIAVYPFEVP
jgi:hypothetical protein